MKNKKKRILITVIAIMCVIGLFTILIVQEEKQKQKKIDFQEKFNHTWYNKTGFELIIYNLSSGSCLYKWRGMSDFFDISNCNLKLDEKNKNLKLTYTLKIIDNGKSKEENVEKYFRYDNNVTELVLQGDKVKEEDFTFTQEDTIQEFDKDYHTYYITNTGAYLKLYPKGICTIDLSSLSKAYPLNGAYQGATLNVVYNNGSCSYTTTNYKDFVIKYDGTFNATMIPGGNLYRNKNVVDTANNEIHISFDDDDIIYKNPKYTNGKWEIGSTTYYKSN